MKPVYRLRNMQRADIPQVLEIDRVSFPIPWSEKTYIFEVTNRETSHLVVLEQMPQNASRFSGLGQLVWRALGQMGDHPLIGYGGCWLIAGEGHISTIAVHPDFRGRGLGELLLAGMLQRTMNLGAEYSVLEVRESNRAAQVLYEKYEYTVVGRRKGYYHDNGEDALLMEVRPLDQAYYQRFTTRVKMLQARVTYIDRFSQSSR